MKKEYDTKPITNRELNVRYGEKGRTFDTMDRAISYLLGQGFFLKNIRNTKKSVWVKGEHQRANIIPLKESPELLVSFYNAMYVKRSIVRL